jgi:hypothetical protein
MMQRLNLLFGLFAFTSATPVILEGIPTANSSVLVDDDTLLVTKDENSIWILW